MSPVITHPTAIVSPEASIGAGTEIGPYAVIGPKVRIGEGCRISSHVHIEGNTEIGDRCVIFPGTVLGTPAQVRSNEKTVQASLYIGHDNIIREYVTIHASMKEGGRTMVGDRNLLMANTHIAHDCVVGSDITMANLATLGGHVVVEDSAVIGGLVAIHQFVRIGKLAMVGAFTKISMDVPPFSIADGRLAKFHGINAVGLKRAGYSAERRNPIRIALKMLCAERGNMSLITARLREEFKGNADVETLLEFVKGSKRGITRSGQHEPAQEE